MKKLFLVPLSVLAIALFSFSDYDICSGVDNSHKALACSACHGGTLAGLIGGKEGVKGESSVLEYELLIPNVEAAELIISSSFVDPSFRKPKIKINGSDSFFNNGSGGIFNLTDLLYKKSDGDYSKIIVELAFDEPLAEDQTYVIQGVYSNNDGSVEGDYSFYEEILIEAQHKNDPTIISYPIIEKSYFKNNFVNIFSEPNTLVRIIDLQGKIVHQNTSEGDTSMDVSHLTSGAYFVVIGNTGNELETFQFVK